MNVFYVNDEPESKFLYTDNKVVWYCTECNENLFFSLYQILSEYPAFNLFSPTIIDLDGNGGEMEVVVALSTGNIHVFTPSTFKQSGQRHGFPLSHNTVHGQVWLLFSSMVLFFMTIQHDNVVMPTFFQAQPKNIISLLI